ncbi:MAG: CoA transferase subunit A [Deltaproteobacteria bacterium]|nr:CoA transferase subunit A [Deltaproteobacteria bacterium]
MSDLSQSTKSAKKRSKIFDDAAAALFDLDDGMSVMSGGFGLSGNAENCITAIATSGKKNLTIIANNCGNQRQGLAVLLQNKQVKRFIGSFVGGNPDLEEQMLGGLVDVELSPQGTFAERIRAGGAGIGGFYTPTGVGTLIAAGKDERSFDVVDADGSVTSRRMILETGLRADFAIVRAKVADEYGNLRFYRTSRNFSPLMAMAARTTIVEAEEIVPVGAIDPDDVHLSGLFVQRIVKAVGLKNVIEQRTTRPRSA